MMFQDAHDFQAIGGSSAEAADIEGAPFIPGLPDDVALNVITRVPRCHIQALRKVCRRWRSAVGSEAFFELRQRLGITEPWLYASISDWEGANAWFAYDPVAGQWQRVPPIPCSEHRNVLTLQFAALKGKLLVSGMVEKENPVAGANGAFLYDPRGNSWRKAACINVGRWFCMSGIVGGQLYLAGGIATNNLALVPSVEVYDMERDSWRQLEGEAKVELMTLPGYQAVLDGKLYAKNIGWGPRLGVAYDPVTRSISELSHRMVQGWQGPTAAVEGKLYIVDFGDGFRLKSWEPAAERWQPVGDVRMPAGAYKPWAVQLVFFMGQLCLLLPNLSLLMVDLRLARTSAGSSGSSSSAPRVVLVEGPAFSHPTRGDHVVSTAAVLGCQVLEA